KAAVEGLTKVWAKELGQKYGITVNCINPGPVDTDMYRAAGEVHLKRMEEENAKTPAAPRAGTSEDIAEIIQFREERSTQRLYVALLERALPEKVGIHILLPKPEKICSAICKHSVFT
ncbi:hypothetical protein D0868_16612, partial [Hortaea werneckii]